MATSVEMTGNEIDNATDPALVVTFGTTSKRRRVLSKMTNVLGRARGCDITLDNPEVAAVHCLIVRTHEGLVVRDCQSRAGTLVNDQPIREATLKDGDLLQVGPFSFKVSIPAGAVSSSAAAAAVAEELAESSQLIEVAVKRVEAQRRELDALENELAIKEKEFNERSANFEKDREQFNIDRAKLDVASADMAQRARFGNELSYEQARAEALEAARNEVVAVEVEPLRREIALLKQNVDDAKADRDRAVRETAAERKALEDMLAEARLSQVASTEAASLRAEIRALKQDLAAATAERDAMLSRLGGGGGEAGENRELQFAKEALTAANAESDRLRGEIVGERARFEARIEELRSAAGSPAAAAADVQNEINFLKESVVAANAECDKLRARMDNDHQESERRLGQMRSELDQERLRLKDLLKQAATQHESTRQEINRLKKEHEQKDLELGALREAVGSGGQVPAEIQQELETLRATIADLEHRVATAGERPALPDELIQYEAQLNEYRTQLETAQAQFEQRDAELQDRLRQGEMQLSKERAELARERAGIERMRLDFKSELEHAERGATINQRLAPLNQLKDELRHQQQQKAAAKEIPAVGGMKEKIRNLLKRLGDK